MAAAAEMGKQVDADRRPAVPENKAPPPPAPIYPTHLTSTPQNDLYRCDLDQVSIKVAAYTFVVRCLGCTLVDRYLSGLPVFKLGSFHTPDQHELREMFNGKQESCV
jgi:hypothetical protein